MDGNLSELAWTPPSAPNECTANEIPSRGFSSPQHEHSVHQATSPQLLTKTSDTEEQRKYVDIGELAARTGMSPSTINRLKKQGKIPFYQPGGKRTRVLFPPDAIEQASSSQSSLNVDPPANRRDSVVPDCADASENFALLHPNPNSSQLPGPAPRWRRHAR